MKQIIEWHRISNPQLAETVDVTCKVCLSFYRLRIMFFFFLNLCSVYLCLFHLQ